MSKTIVTAKNGKVIFKKGKKNVEIKNDAETKILEAIFGKSKPVVK